MLDSANYMNMDEKQLLEKANVLNPGQLFNSIEGLECAQENIYLPISPGEKHC